MRHILLLLAISLGCAGCAFTEDKIDIRYQAASEPPVPGAGEVTLQVETTDQRPGDSTQVGAKKNGYGMEMASIRATRPVAEIVQAAVSDELRARGFRLGAPGQFVLSIGVVRFRNTFDTGFFSSNARAEVTLAVQVRNPAGQITFSQTVLGEGLEKEIQIMGGQNARTALERALPDAVGKITNNPAFLRALTQPSRRPFA